MIRKLRIATFKLLDILVILTMLSASPMNVSATALAQEASPVLAVNPSDYAPGGSAHVTGSGFTPGDYILAINSPEMQWGPVTPDGDGNFESDSPALDSAGSYEVRAYTSPWNGNWDDPAVASTTFTVTAPPPATEPPTEEPTQEPMSTPTNEPTAEPTTTPTDTPTEEPTATQTPTEEPTAEPTQEPGATPTDTPTDTPTTTPSEPPTIQSEYADYNPGQLVRLTGTGWQGDTTVIITVVDAVPTVYRDTDQVQVQPDGTISDSFNLPTTFVDRYFVTAKGAQTGRIATTTFTDANPSADLDQCANDPAPSPSSDGCSASASDWVNGNLGASKAIYFEGDSIPYRLKFDNLSLAPHTVTIEWDTTKGGTHALDYLTTFNSTVTTANPCLGVSGCNPGIFSTFAIPPDPQVTGAGVTPVAGVFTLYGGTITGVSAYSYPNGTGFVGDKSARITITFTSSVANPVLAWGGHISTRADWGANNSAVAIPGSPYHTSLVDLDGAGGRQDRSLSAEAVIFPGSITIIKDATPNSSTSFGFTASPSPLSDFSLVDDGTAANTKVFSNITTFQTYTLNESSIPAGWGFDSVLCSVTTPNGGSYTTSTTTTSINMQEGENWTCTYLDSQRTGTLTVIKHVVNNNGGTATADQWSIHVMSGGNEVSGSPQAGSESGTNYTLAGGTYSVSETGGPSGYTFTGFTGDCDSSGNVTVVVGQNKTCTITNDDQAATLIVIKHVVNNNGGTATAADFTLDSGGANDSPDDFPGAEAPGTTVTLDAGTYTVTESGPSGYTASFSADCSGSIANGQTKTCTVTNDDNAATLIVIKHVINDNGGTATAGNFTMNVTATNPSDDSFPGAEAPGTTITLDAGSYSVSETGPSGYTASYSSDCAGTIAAGQTKTCTVTNDDQPGTLIVKKVVVNDNGGTATADDFSFEVNGGTAIPFEADGQNDLTVDAGTYDVTEPAVTGYSSSYDNCTDVVVPNGGSATCTITNDDVSAHLTLVKEVVNDNGGTATANQWTLSAAGPTPLSGAGGADGDVNAGNYTLSETGPAGYTASAWSCVGGSQNGNQITLANGQSATCTITNDDQAAHLKLVKVVVNDNGGTAVATNFTLSADGPTPISGAGSAESDVDAGTYTLSETSVPGYSASAWSCVGGTQNGSDITLGNGQSATCTITNHDNAPSLTLVKAVVNDNGGTAETTDFSLSANGPTPISGAGGASSDASFQAGTYDLSETNVPGYSGSTWVCSGGDQTDGDTVVIGLGEDVTCTITNDDDAPSLTLVKQVINDNGGTAVAANFTLSANGPTPISGAGGAISDSSFAAGTYDLSETNVPGYTASDWVCAGGTQNDADTVTVGLGQDVTCTITNDDNAPSLTLVKLVVNDNGGTATANQWTLTASGPTGFSGAGPSVSSDADFDAGTYTLSESGPAGYTASAWSCVGGTQNGSDITLANGQSATCTITNNDNAPSLTLVKLVINDNGGTALTTNFTLSANGPTPISGAGGATSDATFDAGTYDLSESGPAGYTASDWVCTGGTQNDVDTITLGLGESATCTITNDDQAPSLILIKMVINNDGGNALTSEWTLTASGPTGFSGPGPSVSSGSSFEAGTYDLSESGPTGYLAGDWVCAGGTQDDADTITLELGESATCTITNNDVAPTLKLVKVVSNNNGGNAVADDWTLFAEAALPNDGRNFSNLGGSGVFQTVFANTGYDLSESTVAGYTAGNWSCDGGTLVDSTITLAEGETGVTCTITNDDSAPTLTLIKIVVNDDGGNAAVSDFPLFIDGNSVTSGTSNTLSANTLYTASETTLAGYTPSVWGGDCNPDGTITLNEGETAVCTITNDDVAPTLTLIKNVINDDGGNAAPDDFKLTIAGNPATSDTAYTLEANTAYEINETLLSGYSFVEITGDPECPAILGGTVTLDEGENVTCTITNDDVAPTLTLIKIVVNDDGGNAVVSDFPLFINGNPVTSGAANTLSANTLYTASETALAGYTPSTWGGDCAADGTITLNEGDNKTCTITNDDVAPTLKLVKNVLNDNGGNAVADDWTLSAAAAAPFNGRNLSNLGGSGVFQTVFANQGYDLSETTVSGYTAGSWSCTGGTLVGSTFTLTEGETGVTCTITNDDQPATLIVIKHVINDNGGTADAADFTLDSGGSNDTPDDFAGDESGTTVTLNAGTYNVTETGPSGYSASFSADCSGTIANGETKTCIVTNDDIQPQLIVIKHVINDNGGTANAGDFLMEVSGNNVNPVTFPGNELGTNVALDAGSYSVGETGVPGYAPSFSADCTGSIAVGETKTCTIINNDISPTLTVIKVLLPGNDTGLFNLQIDGATQAADVGDNGTTGPVAVNAGSHTVGETAGTGTSLSNYVTTIGGDCAADGTVSLALAENKTCTITNVRRGSIVIVKNALGGDGTFDFTSSTLGDFSLTTASNTASTTFSNLDVDLTYDVAETVPTGWDLTSATCDSGETIDSIDLEPGETVTCTFTNTKRGIIVITKEAIPDDPQDFNFTATESTDTPIPDFTLDDDADGTLPKTMTFTDLKPGNYTVTETLVAGWDLNGMSCASTVNLNSGVNVDLNTGTATVNLGPGDTVVCTFRNTKRGHIIVDKVTNPADDPQSFSFDANGGFSPVYTDFNLTDAAAPNDQELRAGSYSVTETLPAGWDLESSSCTSSLGDTETPALIELDPGETVNCTFVNEKDAFIIVEKQTDPNSDPTLFDFTTNYGPAFQLSDGQTNNSGDLDPGTYSVTETVPAGWDLENVACTSSIGDTETATAIELDAGETVTCVFTNERDAFIIVEKQTVPDGDPQLFDFTPSYGSAFQLSDGQTNDSGDLDPGTYSVAETVPAGWDLNGVVCSDGSSAANISLQAGETVTCIFTNTKRGHIIIDKVTLPSGDTQSFSFTTTGTGYNAFSLTDAAAPNDQELVPGVYSVTETALAGWDLTGISCTDPSGAPVIASNKATINLAAGEIVKCTFTNTKRGKITIVKDAVPNDAQDFAFTSTITGAASFNLDDDSNATLSNSKIVTNLLPGAYSVTEGAVAGWDLTGLTCNDANGTTNLGTRTANIALDPGEEVTCTFTNTKRGTIIVEKQTNPNGAPGLFTFTGTAAGTIADNGTITVANLVPGTYTSTEADPSGILFALTSIVCNDGSSLTPSTGNVATRTATFNLDPGETVKCTFTNTKDFHAGTIGFWKNWRNHYTSSQFQILINYLKTNNPKVYNKDLVNNTADDLTSAKVDTIMNVGNKTPREQMILAQFTALKLNLAITQLDGTGDLVQKNDDICLGGTVDVSGISGATDFFGTSTPTIEQVVNKVESKWTGKLTTNRSDWKWNLTTSQKDMLIKVLSGINEGTLVMSRGCP